MEEYVGKQTPSDPMETVRRCKSLSDSRQCQFARDLVMIQQSRVEEGWKLSANGLRGKSPSDWPRVSWRET